MSSPESTNPNIVTTVVAFLGAIAAGGVFIVGALLVIAQINHSTVDAAALAILSGLTGTALGSLGSMLVSTRTGEAVPAQVADTLAKLNPAQTAEMVTRLTRNDDLPPCDPATVPPSPPPPSAPEA